MKQTVSILKNDHRGISRRIPKMEENPEIFMIERFRSNKKSFWLVKVLQVEVKLYKWMAGYCLALTNMAAH